MAPMERIRSLRQSVAKVANAELKNEMMDKVNEVQGDLVTTHERLRARETELNALRARVAAKEDSVAPATEFYDPPM